MGDPDQRRPHPLPRRRQRGRAPCPVPLGDEFLRTIGGSAEQDVVELIRARNVIFDQVSVAWGIDENLAIVDSRDVTVSNSIITEGLYDSIHPQGGHGFCAFQRASQRVTWYSNLISHCERRFPQVSKKGDYQTEAVIANNVIHDYLLRGSTVEGGVHPSTSYVDFVNNFYRRSPSSNRQAIQMDSPAPAQVWLEGNIGPTDNTPPSNQWNALVWGDTSSSLRASRARFPNHVPARPAVDARVHVLDRSGAWPRDSADQRVVRNARDGRFGLIDSPRDVGGWPTLASGTSLQDSNNDGIADSWKVANGLDPNQNIANQQLPGAASGWTWMDAYLHHRHQVVTGQ